MHYKSLIGGTVLFLAVLMLAATGAAETNTIQLFVHPGSGTVCLDNSCQVNQGTLSGYSSTRFSGVASGQDHTIKVYDTDGYQDYTDTVYMDLSGHPMTFSIFLEPVPAQPVSPGTGTIQVTVSPGLGQVCLDNRECESGTGDVSTFWSVQFSDVPADSVHTISVTADGYEPYSQQVTIQADQRNDFDVSLQPLAQADQPAEVTTEPAALAPTTRAGLDGSVALVAAGIGDVVFLGVNRRK